MAKSREERLRELLHPKERVVYEGRIHGTAYIVPAAALLLGVILTFSPETVYHFVPQRYHELTEKFLYWSQELFFGAVFILAGISLSFGIHMRQKHEITIITSERIVSVTGTFFPKQQQFYLNRIGNVRAKQSLFDRMIAQGRLIVHDKIAVHGNKELEKKHVIEFTNIAHPATMKKAVLHAVEAYSIRAAEEEKRHTHTRLGVTVKVD